MNIPSTRWHECHCDLFGITQLNLRLSIQWHKDGFRSQEEYINFIKNIKESADSVKAQCIKILKTKIA